MLLEELKKHEEFYIFGAQVVAYGAYKAIRYLTGKSPKCFLVSNREKNPANIDEIIVCTPEKADKNTLIIIAVTELFQAEIVKYLKVAGFQYFIRLTQHEEYLLMSEFYEKRGNFITLKKTEHKAFPEVGLYEVKNHHDKKLDSYPGLKNFEYSIQAGAALVEEKTAPYLDNTGTNISYLNKQYCEMTATYWVWKNTHHEWKGIEHYRRHLLIEPQWLNKDIDAVLPLPYMAYPNTIHQFRRFVSADVCKALLKALRDIHPDEYYGYMDILCNHYQYTYNLVCAKAEIFDAYCAWFFEITQYMEKMEKTVPEIKETRALSYVAEVLTNLYFMSNRRKLHIYHAEKEIYV